MKKLLKRYRWKLVAFFGLMVLVGSVFAVFLPPWVQVALSILGCIIFLVATLIGAFPSPKG